MTKENVILQTLQKLELKCAQQQAHIDGLEQRLADERRRRLAAEQQASGAAWETHRLKLYYERLRREWDVAGRKAGEPKQEGA